MIDHSRKLIFIHIPKTGGTSVEVALGARLEHHEPVDNPFGVERVEAETDVHLPARLLKETLPGLFESYLTACFVRNTYSFVYSAYRWLRRTYRIRMDFATWVKRGFPDTPERERNIFLEPCQLDWIIDRNGEVIVDFMGRFEALEEDFRRLCGRLEVEAPPLPHLNSTARPGTHYSRHYDSRTRDLITERYQRDIEFFGFRFEDQAAPRSVLHRILTPFRRRSQDS